MVPGQALEITLIISGLTGILSEQQQANSQELPSLSALSDLLNRSRRVARNLLGFESVLGEQFGFPAQQRLPLAALTYWHDCGQPASKPVLRADPVYLKVDRDCLFLLGRQSLQVSLEEARRLAALINQTYADTPWTLEIGTADRWYLCSEDEFNINTHAITEVMGKNVDAYLPQGEAGQQWRAVLNELQMVLHNSDVNLKRETNRRLPINSLWLWGEGQLPPRPASHPENIDYDYVWSNDALCAGLARWAQYPFEALPATASEWIERARAGRHMLVFDDMRTLAREDFDAWEHKLAELHENWLIGLCDVAKSKNVQLRIETCNGIMFEGTRTLWNKLWRHKRQWHQWFQ